MAEQSLRGQQGHVFGHVLAVHDQMLPVQIELDVVDAASAQSVDDMQGHAYVAHEDLHGGLGVLVLQEQLDSVAGAHSGCLLDAIDEAAPTLRIRGLEGVVVALDTRPDDVVRSQAAGELGSVQRPLQSQRPHLVVRR